MADTRLVSDKPLTFDCDLDLGHGNLKFVCYILSHFAHGNLHFVHETSFHFALSFCEV